MEKRYKEPIEEEMETTINVIYDKNLLVVYTNKPKLERELNNVLGEPFKEDKRGKSICSSTWKVSLDEKSKISKMMLKANIFEL